MAKKRGRKSKNKMYFGAEQELAVVCFLSATTYEQKNKIYNEKLFYPINKMIESIIRTYKLYRKDMSFEDLHADTLSFLITKVDKFNPEKGTKAYSYFGTICKHYLLAQLMKDDKHTRRNISYEDVYLSIEEREDMIYRIDDDINMDGFLKEVAKEIREVINTQELNENEIKVGYSIITILEEWKTLFEDKGNNKYNKNLVLSHIREMTNLTTKEIRSSMKKYKKLYYILKEENIKDGLL